MNAQTFLTNLLNMRSATLRKGVCKKNVVMVSDLVGKTKSWMDAWKPTEQQCRSYLMRHSDEINALLPGGHTKQAETWRRNFNTLLGA